MRLISEKGFSERCESVLLIRGRGSFIGQVTDNRHCRPCMAPVDQPCCCNNNFQMSMPELHVDAVYNYTDELHLIIDPVDIMIRYLNSPKNDQVCSWAVNWGDTFDPVYLGYTINGGSHLTNSYSTALAVLDWNKAGTSNGTAHLLSSNIAVVTGYHVSLTIGYRMDLSSLLGSGVVIMVWANYFRTISDSVNCIGDGFTQAGGQFNDGLSVDSISTNWPASLSTVYQPYDHQYQNGTWPGQCGH